MMQLFFEASIKSLYIHRNVGVGLVLKHNPMFTMLTFAMYLRPTRCASVAIDLSYAFQKNVCCWFARVGLKQTSKYNLNLMLIQSTTRPTPTLINALLAFRSSL
jgi:hypothetical protein